MNLLKKKKSGGLSQPQKADIQDSEFSFSGQSNYSSLATSSRAASRPTSSTIFTIDAAVGKEPPAQTPPPEVEERAQTPKGVGSRKFQEKDWASTNYGSGPQLQQQQHLHQQQQHQHLHHVNSAPDMAHPEFDAPPTLVQSQSQPDIHQNHQIFHPRPVQPQAIPPDHLPENVPYPVYNDSPTEEIYRPPAQIQFPPHQQQVFHAPQVPISARQQHFGNLLFPLSQQQQQQHQQQHQQQNQQQQMQLQQMQPQHYVNHQPPMPVQQQHSQNLFFYSNPQIPQRFPAPANNQSGSDNTFHDQHTVSGTATNSNSNSNGSHTTLTTLGGPVTFRGRPARAWDPEQSIATEQGYPAQVMPGSKIYIPMYTDDSSNSFGAAGNQNRAGQFNENSQSSLPSNGTTMTEKPGMFATAPPPTSYTNFGNGDSAFKGTQQPIQSSTFSASTESQQLQRQQQRQQSTQQQHACICCGNPKGMYCKHCKALYCVNCNANPDMAGVAHATLHASSVTDEIPVFCLQHNMEIDVYCRECEDLLCSQCVIFGKHKRHQCVPLHDVYAECMAKIRGQMHTLSQMHKQMRFFEDKLYRTVSEVQQSIHNTSAEIHSAFEEVLDRLDAQERVLSNKICDSANEKERIIVARGNLVLEEIHELNETYHNVQRQCQSMSKAAFLQGYKQILLQLSQFEKVAAPVPDVDCQVQISACTMKVMQEISKLSLQTVFDPIELRFTSDLDKNGLFYYLGTVDTNSATTLTASASSGAIGGVQQFHSPVVRGLVEVTASKWHVGSDAYTSAACWQANIGWLVTENTFGSWICFSLLGGHQIIPKHYRIQNGSQAKIAQGPLKHVLRNWRFEGSQNKLEWDVLSQHNDDTSLQERVHFAASWPLQATRPYKHLRIITSGRNSSMQFFTHFGSIEVWGTLLKQATDSAIV